jgi:hypothetical protein|tara:strand:+ start:1615 stop:2115 length:501 start_codon:yes stop_codon:yes gene_type:complete
METSIYINNNPGNIKYFGDGGVEGVDYYLGKGDTGIKYRKFKSKADGLSAILDTVYKYGTTNVDEIMGKYASDDKSGTAIEDYGSELRFAYDVAKNLDYDNAEQLKNFVQGITHFENSANSEDYANYYTEKDYEDAVKLFQEKKLFEQIDNVETKGEGFEMRKLGL